MSDDKDDNQTVVWAVLVSVVVLAVSLAIGFGIAKSKKAPSTAPVVTAAAPAEAASEAVAQASAPAVEASVSSVAPVLAANESAVRVENGVVKFYFASGKATLAAGAKEALAEVVQAAAQGKKLVLSGFHDSTGDLAKNEELAKHRAFAVRDALKALGVSDDKLELKKPEVMTGTGSAAEARRVEVSVQ